MQLNYDGPITWRESTANNSTLSFSGRKSTRKSSLTTLFPKSDIYSNLISDQHTIFELDPMEVCQQLALYEFELFSKIPSCEFLYQIWGVNQARELRDYAFLDQLYPDVPTALLQTHNITAHIQHTIDLTFWVARVILESKSLQRRAVLIKFLIQLAKYSCDCGNFTAASAIVSGLSIGPVARLVKTWKYFNSKYQSIKATLDSICSLLSPRFKYSNYRKHFSELPLPALPFLGIFIFILGAILVDLSYLDLGLPDFLTDSDFINFEKRRMVFRMMQEIKKYKTTIYTYAKIPQIQDFFHHLSNSRATGVEWGERFATVNSELYEYSYLIEPRGAASEDHDDN